MDLVQKDKLVARLSEAARKAKDLMSQQTVASGAVVGGPHQSPPSPGQAGNGPAAPATGSQ